MTQPQSKSTLTEFLDRLRWPVLLVALSLACACGTIDPGEADLARVQRLPDPRRYGLEIHPLLAGQCSAANCHGGPGTFQLVTAEVALLPEQVVDHPQDLPEPFRAGYYTVLGLCDLAFPADSQLLTWGGGDLPQHPGGQALGATEASQILSWLRSGGGD